MDEEGNECKFMGKGENEGLSIMRTGCKVEHVENWVWKENEKRLKFRVWAVGRMG